MTSFGLLHLSDLHLGNPDRQAFAPLDRKLFLDDLSEAHQLSGPFDLVVISGDLTDAGAPDQFKRAQEFVQEFWGRLKELGSQPKLLTVPGNHDVQLPEDAASEALLSLMSWPTYKLTSETFWTRPLSSMRKRVEEALGPYQAWLASCAQAKETARTVGLLPGDCTATLEKDGVRLGLMALNTSFLHLWKEQPFPLELDVRQLNAVCGGDPLAWLEEQDCTLLITHHPHEKLSAEAQAQYKELIHPPGRFVFHLFGYSDKEPWLDAVGGAQERCYVPGLSLFGRRSTAQMGYRMARIEVAPERVSFTLRSRLAQKNVAAGYTRFVPGTEWSRSMPRTPRAAAPMPPGAPEPAVDKVLEILADIQKTGPLSMALQELGEAPPAQLEELRRALAAKLLQPREISPASIEEACRAMKHLFPFLKEQSVTLLELVTPFRWVPAQAAQMLSEVTRRSQQKRVVGLNGTELDFTGRMYAYRANPGNVPAWDLVQLSKLYECSFEELQRQTYDCLKSQLRLEPDATDAMVDEELATLENIGSAVLVLLLIEAPVQPLRMQENLQRLREHFRTLTFLFFTGAAAPPPSVDVLLPRLDPDQERKARTISDAISRSIKRHYVPSKGEP